MEFVLIKRDFRDLKIHLFSNNNINDWNKILIIYNLYLFFNHLYISYNLINIISNDNNTEFRHQFKNIYIFFFILCNLKNSYGYFILNVYKIDPKLANSFFKNTHHYFL
jgi:hypothetical protein